MNSFAQNQVTKPPRKNLAEVGLDLHIDEIIDEIQLSKLRWSKDLTRIIKQISLINPYADQEINIQPNSISSRDSQLMWIEQCCINFPLLYLSSIYLYIYAKQKGCDTFLFAT